MSTWVKAGLVGGVVVAILNVLGIIPCAGVFFCGLGLVAYAGVGALAAYWMPPIREAGQAAGQGALAAGLAAVIGGIVNWIVVTIQFAATDTATVLQSLPSESLQQLRDAGIDPATLAGTGAGAAFGGICCGAGLLIAIVLGAIGGAILAAVKSD
ncbi:MAG: hypothetical protein P8129_01950 [Anaerolineae bacterium]